MGSSSSRVFSPSWIVASFLMIEGGLALALSAGAAAGLRSQLAAYAVFAAGAAVGGFTAGRASAHRSVLEPAIAGALVVVAVIAVARATPVGRLVLAVTGDAAMRESLRFGGIGFAAGLVGALAGELVTRGDPPGGAIRWMWTSTLVTAGALVVAATAAAVLLLNEASERAIEQFFRGELGRRPLVEKERVAITAAVSVAAASFVGGAVTQMAAPRRLLVPSASGAAAVVGGIVLASGAAAGDVRQMAVPAAITAGIAAAIALGGAVLGRLVSR